jgi:hypothetical protein
MLPQLSPANVQLEDAEPMGRVLLLGIDHRTRVEK